MLDSVLILKILLLLLIANGAPIVAARLFRTRFNTPVDFSFRLWDQHHLFGNSKTWRGILSALLCTTPVAVLFGFSPAWGMLIAALAMAGDLCSSFIKRRLGIASSARTLFLDQVPESLLPVSALAALQRINWLEAGIIIVAFVIADMALSRLLYRLHIRKHPY